MEADFHAAYGVADLQAELGRRTWRWFTVKLRGLPADSNWSHAIWPVDPDTGKRTRRAPVTVLDDPDQVDAFFARQAG